MRAAAGIDPNKPKLCNFKKRKWEFDEKKWMWKYLQIDFISRAKSVVCAMKWNVEMWQTMKNFRQKWNLILILQIIIIAYTRSIHFHDFNFLMTIIFFLIKFNSYFYDSFLCLIIRSTRNMSFFFCLQIKSNNLFPPYFLHFYIRNIFHIYSYTHCCSLSLSHSPTHIHTPRIS